MKTTLSIIKADIGSLAGHMAPSGFLQATVEEQIGTRGRGVIVPVTTNTGISYFDGPPVVSCTGFCVHNGKLTEPIDTFAQPFWNTVRDKVANRAMEMRRQGFVGTAMLPMHRNYGEAEGTRQAVHRANGCPRASSRLRP